ncbi:hypothetical protein B296_00044600 [Ensete ventricosum]|uniref:Uncharacterized protein n=1 Tax=Ensete ventricosum TaxID=4639 RepID=A0A426XH39_ENSVE|nr:hypothetical protein B296_00044600 [Ensete ventricosum]
MGRRLVAAAGIAVAGGCCDREGGCGSNEGYSRGGGLQPKVRMWMRLRLCKVAWKDERWQRQDGDNDNDGEGDADNDKGSGCEITVGTLL